MNNADAIERINRASTAGVAGRRGTRFMIGLPGGDTWEGIRDRPAELADAAGVSLDVYSLARLTRSENSRHGPAYRLAVCEVGRNEPAHLAAKQLLRVEARTVTGNLIERTSARWARTRGHYGRQRGRWAATLLDPSPSDVVAAQCALQGTDIARGARRFFSVKAMNGGTQGGRRLRRNGAELIREWGNEGWVWVGDCPGIDPYKLLLLKNVGRPARDAELAQMLAIDSDGRSGKSREYPIGAAREAYAGSGASHDGNGLAGIAAAGGGFLIIT